MKLSVHPLFFAAGIFSAVFGGLPVFLIYTLPALVQECGHIFCARRMGFECSCVKLMPYGAAAVCKIDGILPADEVKLALAGPAVNAAICACTAALWWFFPITYAWTDVVMQANAVMLAVNILPAYPLDGGRVARCILSKVMSPRAASIAIRAATVLVAGGVASLFFFTEVGINAFVFAGFLLVSAFSKDVPASKINFIGHSRLMRGVEIKYILAAPSLTYRRAIGFLDDKRYVIFRTEDGRQVTQDELCEGFAVHGIYESIFGEECAEKRKECDEESKERTEKSAPDLRRTEIFEEDDT